MVGNNLDPTMKDGQMRLGFKTEWMEKERFQFCKHLQGIDRNRMTKKSLSSSIYKRGHK